MVDNSLQLSELNSNQLFKQPAIKFVVESCQQIGIEREKISILEAEHNQQQVTFFLNVWPEYEFFSYEVDQSLGYNFPSMPAATSYLAGKGREVLGRIKADRMIEGIIGKTSDCFISFQDKTSLPVNRISSTWREDCPSCSASGKIICTSGKLVHGTCINKNDCGFCSSTGKYRCINCSGVGYRGVTKTYRRSDGTEYWAAEQERCNPCHGSGYGGSCGHCSGQGYTTSTCATCRGTGKISCSRCEGSGYKCFEMNIKFMMRVERKAVPDAKSSGRFISAFKTLDVIDAFREADIHHSFLNSDRNVNVMSFNGNIRSFSFDMTVKNLRFLFQAIGKKQILANNPTFVDDLIQTDISSLIEYNNNKKFQQALNKIKNTILFSNILREMSEKKYDQKFYIFQFQGGLSKQCIEKITKVIDTTYHGFGQQAVKKPWKIVFVGLFFAASLTPLLGLERFYLVNKASLDSQLNYPVPEVWFILFLIEALPMLPLLIIITTIMSGISSRSISLAIGVNNIRRDVKQKKSILISLVLISLGVVSGLSTRFYLDFHKLDVLVPNQYEKKLDAYMLPLSGQLSFVDRSQDCLSIYSYCKDESSQFAKVEPANNRTSGSSNSPLMSNGVGVNSPQRLSLQAPLFLGSNKVFGGQTLQVSKFPTWRPTVPTFTNGSIGNVDVYRLKYLLNELGFLEETPDGVPDGATQRALQSMINSADPAEVVQFHHKTMQVWQWADVAQEAVFDQIHIDLPANPGPIGQFPNVIRVRLGNAGLSAVDKAISRAAASVGDVVDWTLPDGSVRGKVLASSTSIFKNRACAIVDIEVIIDEYAYHSMPHKVCDSY